MSQPTKSSEVISNNAEELPLVVTSNSATRLKQFKARKLPRLVLLPLIFLIMFTGAVVGIYIQPPSLKLFMESTGLVPGGGSKAPIAIPVPKSTLIANPPPEKIRSVIALGKLIPDGDVITVAMPYGAGDARIELIHAKIGQRVKRGDILAILDNTSTLQSAVETAQANVALKSAALKQTRNSIIASLNESKATLARFEATVQVAKINLKRQQQLFKDGLTTQSSLDDASLKARETKQDVKKAKATLSRYKSKGIDNQPDVLVAARNLDSVHTELNRARKDLARGTVVAPVSGTVLNIHVHSGEKPGSLGIVDIGNTDRMTAELEVYQSEIARVRVGFHVELTSDALASPLVGLVSEIGYTVGKQSQISSDAAANTDARVIKVTVQLDEASSILAAKLTFLEVLARIAVEEDR